MALFLPVPVRRGFEPQQYVFKFSRITLPQHIKDRLEEEGFMLSQVEHQGIPEYIAFQTCSRPIHIDDVPRAGD